MTSLSSQERTVIQTLLELNYSIRAIARFIKRSPSTVSIEIHQVTPYKAEIAHALALKKRHLRGRHDTLTPAIAVFLNHHIGILKWSPETAAHVLGYLSKRFIIGSMLVDSNYHWLIYLTKVSVKNVNLMVDDKYLCMVVRLKRDLKV
ncbi:hypothetical protein Llac01_11740 [Leuconostoc lactis]|nr:hypothetical protein LLA04_13690 [Leuconostoc lactis]GLY45797.1 hypothetical protein Llac01_11740 [Leuconostoc lactis]